MRITALFGRKYGGKTMELIHGPDVPIAKQLETYQKMKGTHQNGNLVNDTYEYIEHWERHHISNALKFTKPKKTKPETTTSEGK